MDTILIAVLSVTVIGAVCAAALCAASKFMYVEVDERVRAISECLPGTNCGACGFPGCEGYATALVQDSGVAVTLCTPGGNETAMQIGGILGVEAGDVAAKLAFIRCRGDVSKHEQKMDYKGIQTCYAAKQIFGGGGACAFGCLGYGDCLTVCPDDAICIEGGIARINTRVCTGCGLCVKACSQNLITIEDADIKPVILCANTEKGAVARKKCASACIACTKCVRECPSAAITLENFLAVIDYTKCTACGHCAQTCPTRCIQF
jgi:Na+-translocating ferredoxin:NAD+ oxidoreductase RNF subunit RnfB